MTEGNILEVRDLTVRFMMNEGTVHAVNGVTFSLPEGKSIGIVGESGCGKTVSAYSVTQLLPKTARVSGQILFREKEGTITDIAKLPVDGKEIRRIRGQEISMIFQEPMSSLSPVHTVFNQLAEAMILFQGMTKKQARERCVELLKLVGIENAERRVDEYPFQFSGGMRQRAMIAMALARNPRILIADEPTTALDVTLQAQVLSLIQEMQDEFKLSMILITHALGVVAHMVDYIHIMYLGRVVESGPTLEIFENPKHPYTRGLLNSIPKLHGKRGQRVSSIPGAVPSAYSLPEGCVFRARCSERRSACMYEIPRRIQVGSEHYVSCCLYDGEEDQYAANA
ncbi:MAG: ABC transporter ATP-binding protein [Firmicutes bacterium]|nr:ABC transporter ATP-binding protein [Bacillota bacterium]